MIRFAFFVSIYKWIGINPSRSRRCDDFILNKTSLMFPPSKCYWRTFGYFILFPFQCIGILPYCNHTCNENKETCSKPLKCRLRMTDRLASMTLLETCSIIKKGGKCDMLSFEIESADKHCTTQIHWWYLKNKSIIN